VQELDEIRRLGCLKMGLFTGGTPWFTETTNPVTAVLSFKIITLTLPLKKKTTACLRQAQITICDTSHWPIPLNFGHPVGEIPISFGKSPQGHH
jgi:hypothetical protein